MASDSNQVSAWMTMQHVTPTPVLWFARLS